MSNEYEYRLLGRLKSDCYAYTDYGGRLWGITPVEHIGKMYEIWEKLDTKPEWLTRQELKKLSIALTGKERS